MLVVPPLGRWCRDELFAQSMVDVALAFGVAPLVVLGAPWQALARALALGPDGSTTRGEAVSRRSVPSRSVPSRSVPSSSGQPGEASPGRMRSVWGGAVKAAPVAGAAVLIGVVVLWHLPAVLDASVGSPVLWDAQMACYLGAGIVLWLQLVGSRPFEPAWSPLARNGLVVAVLAVGALVGAAMMFGPGSWYPAFPGGAHGLMPWSVDQGFAGGIAGLVPAIPLGAYFWWSCTEWLNRDELGAAVFGPPAGGPSLHPGGAPAPPAGPRAAPVRSTKDPVPWS